MRRVVSLYLPTWTTDRLRRRECHAPDRPLVTVLSVGQRRVLAAVDAIAAAEGLRPGMTLGHAQALVSGLAVAPADPEAEAADLGRLAAWCLRYGPASSAAPPDGLWFDASGLAALYDGEAGLMARLIEGLAGLGFTVRAALADTPGAAHALARFGPDKIALVPPGGAAAALADLPVAALRLPPAEAAMLVRLGLDRLASLATIPREALGLRFGAATLNRLDQALGRVFEPIEPVIPPDLPQVDAGFAEPVATREALAETLRRLAAGLARILERRESGARRLDLHFFRVDGQVQSMRIGLAEASRRPAHLADLMIRRLERVEPEFGIDAVRLAATLTLPLAARQLAAAGLGGAEAAVSAATLGELVDRLSGKMAGGRIYRWMPVESDLPERARRRVPALAPPGLRRWPADWPRPVRLIDPPEPVEVIYLLPDHPPMLLVWRRRRHRILRADGPERVYGEWWRGPGEWDETRDYFRVEDAEGSRFWLYRTASPDPVAAAGWFMQGVFG